MPIPVQIKLFGSLSNYNTEISNENVPLEHPTPFLAILGRLKIPGDKVQMIMVNHRAVKKDSDIFPGDRLAIFPREYPLFLDWNDSTMARDLKIKRMKFHS